MGIIYSSEEKMSHGRVYGWYRDTPDERDQTIMFGRNRAEYLNNIPDTDLTSKCPPVYDQGNLGSCVENGVTFAYQYDEMKQKNEDIFTPSRLYVYYNVRDKMGTIDEDSGSSVRDGVKSVNKLGVCNETKWPYDTSKFTNKPSEECYEEGKLAHTLSYKRVEQSLEQLQLALTNNYPVVFGFKVYESFESEEVAKTGIMPYPKSDEKVLGGHCVALVGFNNETKRFKVRNSWGSKWGDKGYFYMPYDFALNGSQASDFWTIKKVTNPDL